MTAHSRLLQLRQTITVALVARALLIASAAALALLALWRAGLTGPVGPVIIALAAVAIAGQQLLRLRGLDSLPRVALWVEERTPALRYALVTVAEGASTPDVDAQALATEWWTDARTALLHALRMPAVATVAAAALVLWHPVLGARGGDAATHAAARQKRADVVDVLAKVHVSVKPPAYAGKSDVELDEPTSIEALVGSAISIGGAGEATRLTAVADSQVRSVAQRGEGWSVSLTMPARPGLVRLHSSTGKDRLIVLAPVVDAVPAVTLLLPARDTIVRRGTGVFALHAQLRDDIGLRDGGFEIVITSGGGENFTFRTGMIGRRQLGGQLESRLDARVSLDSLQLKPGDILQLRAVAHDANTVTGPGTGSSETRAIRVARPDEYDSVSVEALPPPEAEGQVLSQRMLINLTEALVKRQSKLAHPILVDESRRIASDQAKLRKKVGDVVFQRLGAEPLSEESSGEIDRRGKLTPEDIVRMADSVTNRAGEALDVEGDETPILAINKPLLEAFNAMWDAGRALEVGEPAKALPPMRIALAAIEKARIAERIYLRGGAGKNIVDVGKVRLTGKDKGVASIREARAPLNPASRRRSETFERVTALLVRAPDAAADSLLLMRVDALTDAPALAAALDDAARALRRRDTSAVGLAWTRVRRALGGAPRQSGGVSQWSSAP